MERFKLAAFYILLIKLLISFPTSNGFDEYEPSIENYDLIEDVPMDTNPQTTATQDFQSRIKGPKADLHRVLKLINEIFPRLTSIHDNITDLLIFASDDSLGPDDEPFEENRWSLEKMNQINNLAEEELSVVFNMLKRELLTSLNERPKHFTNTFQGMNGGRRPNRLKPTLTKCGGSVSTKNGSIIHEYNEAQSQNCLWVISSQFNKDYLRFTLQDAQLSRNGYANLSIGYFNNSQLDEPDTLVWTELFDLNSTGSVTLEIPSVVAFVHLVSEPGSLGVPSNAALIKNGFILKFEEITTNATTSLKFASSFHNSWNVTFGHTVPGHNATATTYASNLRTIFAFQAPAPETSLYFKWYDLEDKSNGGTVYDSLNIWAFGQNDQWRRIDQLCGQKNKGVLRPYAKKYDFNNEAYLSPMIVTFQTDSSGEFSGFEGYMGETVAPELPDLTDCGGSLSSGSGSISYDYNPDQSQNCLWVISSQLNKDYLRFTLNTAKLQGNRNMHLSVGYFNRSQFDEPNKLIWQKFNLNSGVGLTKEVLSVVAFVHLVSKPGSPGVSSNSSAMISNGFILSFQEIPNNSTPASFTFTSSFHNNWYGHFASTIPGHNATTYASNLRTIFAFQPPAPKTSLYFKWYDLEDKSNGGTVYDSLNIWAFGQNDEWRRIDQIYGRGNTDMLRPFAKKYDFSNDASLSPLIVTFQTDSSLGFTGFEGYIGRTLEKESKVRLFVEGYHKGRSEVWEPQGNECVYVESFLESGEGFQSLSTYDSCVKICDGRDCTGTCHFMYPGTLGHWHLEQINFNKRVKSIRSCF